MQVWVALPEVSEEVDPSFHHHPAATIPRWAEGGVNLTLVAGSAAGRKSPAQVYSQLFYVAAEFEAGTSLTFPVGEQEVGAYVVSGEVEVEDQRHGVGSFILWEDGGGTQVSLSAPGEAVVMLFGGESVGRRFIEWNFVSSSRERIEQAKAEWRAGGFARVPGDDSFIPLPE